MKISKFWFHALSIGIAAAILAGCGGSQSGTPQLPVISVPQVAHGTHRVSPDGIVYTPANVTIIYYNGPYSLSLKNDNVTDFDIGSFTSYHNAPCGGHLNTQGWLYVHAPGTNGVEIASGWVAVLPAGSRIGPSIFGNGTQNMLTFTSTWRSFWGCHHQLTVSGPWNSRTAYAGLAFVRNGKTHYGWAEFYNAHVLCDPRTSDCYGIVTTLTGYAYQTIAGKSIMAGQK